MDILKEKNVEFLQPFLPINDKKSMAERLYEELGSLEGAEKDGNQGAVDAGLCWNLLRIVRMCATTA